MMISTKGRYALRLMLDLAVIGQDKYASIKEISERQNLPEKYLEQIMIQLSKAGYVKSKRGANGGYTLSHLPEQYTVGMIFRLMEGSLAPVSCLQEEDGQCDRLGKCITFGLYEKINNAVNDVIDSVTLADIIADFNSSFLEDFLG